MKIYTKTGDTGTTSLLSGQRVDKCHLRIESYGTIDELNANLGVLRAHVEETSVKEDLIRIQTQLFTIGSNLATLPGDHKIKLPHFEAAEIEYLEQRMDEMDAELPPMRHFLLPGGHVAVAQCHVCRTVCRRAERLVIQLSRENSIAPDFIRYLNRLSDYLFVLSRSLSHHLGVEETPWKPKKE